MIQIGTSYSESSSSEKAAEAAARDAMNRSGASKAQAALIFASANHRDQYSSIAKKVRQVTGASHVVGASGFGVLCDQMEIEGRPGISVMTFDSGELDPHSFMVRNLQEGNLKAGEALGRALCEKKISPAFMLMFPDAFSFQSYLFFDGFENSYGYTPLLGGTAAEDGQLEKSFQICNDEIAFDAVSALAFEGNARVEIGITQSCQPFGEPVQITRADGNMIYEMDGRPAYDILLESLSQIEVGNPDQVFQQIFLGIPLRSYQTVFNHSDYLIRNIMGINAKKGLVACASPVQQGEFVTFTIRDAQRAVTNLKFMLDDLKSRIFPAKPKFGFYFNCSARGSSLYGQNNVDVATIRSYFPEVPIVGFFTYGEIAPLDHVNHLHHYSGVLALVCE